MSSDLLNSSGLIPEKIPAHVAIIMDGNGRWAKKRIMNRIKGHERGAEVVRDIVRASRLLGISYLTLYAFSTENWQRPKMEINALMGILINFLKSEQKEMMDNGIRFMTIGQTHRLPENVQNTIYETINLTRDNQGMVLNLALSYGARDELVMAIKNICSDINNKQLNIDSISLETISAYLYTKDMPDPDIVIRTSGEQRISNFLLWQIAYAELFFTNTLWPDFTKDEFIEILKNYQKRERRFGAVLEN